MRPPLVLGIETSCDDTACAIVDGSGQVLSSVVSSQLAHAPYGGVVPEIASREHLKNWPAVFEEALARAGVELDAVDAVAATRGPGLVGSLLVGLSLGKALAYALERPFFGVHHIEGHLYSPFLSVDDVAEPVPDLFLGLVVSGGHTCVLRAQDGEIETLCETRDDAMGEVFDKVGQRLGLGFPGGPAVDRWAEEGAARATNENREVTAEPVRPFKVARVGDSLDFSFSGLKTQMLVELSRRDVDDEPSSWSERSDVLGLLAEFRAAAVAQLIDRLEKIHRIEPFSMLSVSGGVAANRLLRREVEAFCERRGIACRLVALQFCGDNAAMIAQAALRRYEKDAADDPRSLDATSRLPFERAADFASA